MMSGYPKSKTKENLERTGLRGQGKDNSRDSGFTVLYRYKEVKSKATSYLVCLCHDM